MDRELIMEVIDLLQRIETNWTMTSTDLWHRYEVPQLREKLEAWNKRQ